MGIFPNSKIFKLSVIFGCSIAIIVAIILSVNNLFLNTPPEQAQGSAPQKNQSPSYNRSSFDGTVIEKTSNAIFIKPNLPDTDVDSVKITSTPQTQIVQANFKTSSFKPISLQEVPLDSSVTIESSKILNKDTKFLPAKQIIVHAYKREFN